MTLAHTNYLDHRVVDTRLDTIGTVTDVLYDDGNDTPKWLVVKTGLLRPERFVPTAGSYLADGGDIVVPFDKGWVRSAPKAGDHVMTSAVEREASSHHDVSSHYDVSSLPSDGEG